MFRPRILGEQEIDQGPLYDYPVMTLPTKWMMFGAEEAVEKDSLPVQPDCPEPQIYSLSVPEILGTALCWEMRHNSVQSVVIQGCQLWERGPIEEPTTGITRNERERLGISLLKIMLRIVSSVAGVTDILQIFFIYSNVLTLSVCCPLLGPLSQLAGRDLLSVSTVTL